MRKQSYKFIFLSFISTYVFLFCNSAHAQSAPGGIHFQGQVVDSSGNPLQGTNVIFTLQLTSPSGGVLYEETQTLNMANSNGVFDLVLGSGTLTSGPTSKNPSPPIPFISAFSNSSPFTLAGGVVYTPASGDSRLLKVSLFDGTQTVSFSSPYSLESVPYALYAQTLQGKAPTDLIEVNSTTAALTQANAEQIFSTTNYPALVSLLNGTSAKYVNATSSGGAALPTYASGSLPATPAAGDIWYNTTTQTLQYYNGSVQTLGAGSGTVTSVGLSLPSIFSVSGSPVASSGSLSASLTSQSANTVFAGPSSGGAATPGFRALASADLPTVAVAQGGTGATSLSANGLLMANSSGSAISSAFCSLGQALVATSPSAWGCQSVVSSSTGFVNGGNSFGAATSLGTLDSNNLNFLTNGTSQMTLDTNGRLGIGTATPGYTLDVEQSPTGTGTYITSEFITVANPTGNNTGVLRGVGISETTSASSTVNFSTLEAQTAYVASQGSGNVNLEVASLQEAVQTGNGNVNLQIATYPEALLGGSSSATVTTLVGVNSITGNYSTSASSLVVGSYGVAGFSENNSPGSITNSYGVEGEVTNGGAGTTTNGYGGYFQTAVTSGAITNAYGVYIGTIAGTNKFSLYASDSTSPSYFAGSVGVGTQSPGASLDVKGHVANSGPGASVSSCGTSPAITGNDTRGTVTVGTGAVTSCLITFNAAYSTAPFCVVSWNGTASATGLATSSTTAAVTVKFSASSPSSSFTYYCMQ